MKTRDRVLAALPRPNAMGLSERQLAQLLGLQRGTVRRHLDALHAEKLIAYDSTGYTLRAAGLAERERRQLVHEASAIGAATARALAVIRDRQPRYASAFAFFMWPDSPGWTHTMTVGRNASGAKRAGGLHRAAGGHLAKLRQRGLIDWRSASDITLEREFYLTERGRDALAAYEARHGAITVTGHES